MGRFGGELKILKRVASQLLFCVSLTASPTLADYVAPELTKVSTSHYKPQAVIFAPGTYKYAVKWQGIPVASAEIVMGDKPVLFNQSELRSPDMSTIRVSTKTARVIDLLYKLRHTSESIFSRTALSPFKYAAQQTENSKYKRWQIDFDPSTKVHSKLWKQPDAVDPEEESEFISNNWTIDPLFGAVLARSVPVAVGSQLQFDIWNGKNRYLISFVVDKREEIKIGGKKVLAEKIIPTVQKLTDTEGEKRLKSCTLWVSADDRRDILKVDSKVLIGHLTATLEQFVPFPSLESPPVITASQPVSLSERENDKGRARLNHPEQPAAVNKPPKGE